MTFERFKEMAKDKHLSKFEKIGFPDEYRSNKEVEIFRDITEKLKLQREGLKVADIGCGCSELPELIIRNAALHHQHLTMIDSEEMLNELPTGNYEKVYGRFPEETLPTMQNQRFDAILIYSVLQHVILDQNPYKFIDAACKLLEPGGLLLLGDIPNISKRDRFFSSKAGLEFHKAYTKSDSSPPISDERLIEDKVDDSLILGILMRYRFAGYEVYLVPQSEKLPMANRREDVIIMSN